MVSQSELEAILQDLELNGMLKKNKKVMLYLNAWLYARFKARCEKKGQNVSAVIEAFMKRAVDSSPDEAGDKKLEKEFLANGRSRKR